MRAQQTLFADAWSWRHLRGTTSARFSPCPEHGPGCECPLAVYRYELRRTWDASKRPLVAICLNPSTAGAIADDPTGRRLYAFADRWGLGGLVLLNAFALRSTDPRGLKRAVKSGIDPIGADNSRTIASVLEEHLGDRLILAWGGHGTFLDRGRDVAKLAHDVHPSPECLGLTANGEPRHPLFVPEITAPMPYRELLAEREASR